jgi:hypothetical protein
MQHRSFRRLTTVFILARGLGTSACKSAPPKPGQEAFEKADDELDAYDTKIGFGDDETLAAAFSKKAKSIDSELFSAVPATSTTRRPWASGSPTSRVPQKRCCSWSA